MNNALRLFVMATVLVATTTSSLKAGADETLSRTTSPMMTIVSDQPLIWGNLYGDALPATGDYDRVFIAGRGNQEVIFLKGDRVKVYTIMNGLKNSRDTSASTVRFVGEASVDSFLKGLAQSVRDERQDRVTAKQILRDLAAFVGATAIPLASLDIASMADGYRASGALLVGAVATLACGMTSGLAGASYIKAQFDRAKCSDQQEDLAQVIRESKGKTIESVEIGLNFGEFNARMEKVMNRIRTTSSCRAILAR